MESFIKSSKKWTNELENQIVMLKQIVATQEELIKEKTALVEAKDKSIEGLRFQVVQNEISLRSKDAEIVELKASEDKKDKTKVKDVPHKSENIETKEQNIVTNLPQPKLRNQDATFAAKEKRMEQKLQESIKRSQVSQNLVAHFRAENTNQSRQIEHMSHETGRMTHENKQLTARVGILLQAVDRETSLKERLHRVGVDVCTEKVWAPAVKAMTETDRIRATMKKGKLLGSKIGEMSEKHLEDYYKTLRQELASHEIVRELDLKFDLETCTCTYCNHISKAVG